MRMRTGWGFATTACHGHMHIRGMKIQPTVNLVGNVMCNLRRNTFQRLEYIFFEICSGWVPIQANKLASIECLKNLMSFRKQLSSIYDSL